MNTHVAIQHALRAKLLTLSVATTGVTSLSATATGYARASGSFLTDGFARGMELTPTGFASNPVDVITGVTALTITTATARTAEGAAGGRSLSVGLPLERSWEDIPLTRIAGKPYIEEQYMRGTVPQVTLGPLGSLELTPMYFLNIYVASDSGMEAASAYTDALLALFTPRTAITVGADVLRVRSDVGPNAKQLQQGDPGWSVIPIQIPLRLLTFNSI